MQCFYVYNENRKRREGRDVSAISQSMYLVQEGASVLRQEKGRMPILQRKTALRRRKPLPYLREGTDGAFRDQMQRLQSTCASV